MDFYLELHVFGAASVRKKDEIVRADKISNNPLDNSTRVVGSRRKVVEEVFGVHITKPPLIVTRTAAPNTTKEMEMST